MPIVIIIRGCLGCLRGSGHHGEESVTKHFFFCYIHLINKQKQNKKKEFNLEYILRERAAD